MYISAFFLFFLVCSVCIVIYKHRIYLKELKRNRLYINLIIFSFAFFLSLIVFAKIAMIHFTHGINQSIASWLLLICAFISYKIQKFKLLKSKMDK